MLYAFFWVITRRLEFICRRFGTLCLFHLHRQVDVSRIKLGIRNWTGKGLAPAKPFPVQFLILTFILLTSTCLWRWNRQSVPKRRHINSRRRVITQKKAYNIQNRAKAWNQEYRNFPVFSYTIIRKRRLALPSPLFQKQQELNIIMYASILRNFNQIGQLVSTFGYKFIYPPK